MTLEEQFDAMTAATILQYIADGQQEHTQLEFKELNRPDFKNSDDKKNLAKEISAFANGSGGLIVWGVEAKKGEDGVDKASAPKLIDKLDLALSRLSTLESEAILPRLTGIRHKALPNGDNAGFLVTLVPESDITPHMAKLGVNQYFKRSGDSSPSMEHFDIADMFGRRPHPKLRVTSEFMGNAIGYGRERPASFIVSIENFGRGSARAPFLSLDLPKGCNLDGYGVDGNHRFGLSRIPGRGVGNVFKFGGDANLVLHPGVKLDVTKLIVSRNIDNDLLVSFTVAAEGTNSHSGSLLISCAEARPAAG